MKPTLLQSTAYQDRQHHLHIPRLHPFAGCPAAAAGAASISSQACGLSLDLVATLAPSANSFRRFEGGDLSTAAPRSLEVHSKSSLSETPLRNRAKTDVTGPHATTMNGFHGQQSPPNGAANLTVHAHGLMDGTAASAMSAGHKASGPMPVSGKTSSATGEMSPRALSGAMPRSPPKNKNTAHVPCKFWLAGSCTAGRMCPFSHDLESSTRPAPCKYFAKGGCKFGRKCALLHVAPDGTVVNRVPPASYSQHPRGYTTSSHGLMTGGGYGPASPGLLSMQAQALDMREGTDGSVDYDLHQNIARNGTEQIHIDYTSASPSFGSPQDHRFGASPSQRGLSVLDAPLPSSFDSNGISLAARNGPFAASVPSRFGLESPPASVPRKSHLGSTALRDLHNSAFGDLGMDGVLASMGSSPPSGTDEPLTFPKRSLHSDRLRASRPIFSASLGTRLPMESLDYSDEDGDTDREEDLLPASLRDLIPEGRSRRESRSRNDEDSPAAHLAAQRRTISISGHGTPADSKVGSPHSSSPSRFTGMFAARAQANKSEVGSPLRNAGFSYAQAISSTSSTQSKPLGSGELSPSISSPPRQASMSMLTQELQRTKLDAARAAAAGTSHPLPVTTRSFSNGSASSNPKRRSLERGMSSTSVGKIDEEQELFDMDEVGDRPTATSKAIPRSTPSDINSLSTSPWNARPFGVSMSSSPNHRKVDPSELLTFGAIGSHRK